MQVERVDFVSFLTRDIPRAKEFYTEVLGLEIESEGDSDQTSVCRQAWFEDPDGNALMLHRRFDL